MLIIQLLQDAALPQKVILEKLICHQIQKDKTRLLTHTDTELSDDQVQRIQESYHKYTQDKQPLEYILGHVDFLGVSFAVTPATLIPRPETEYMIQAVNEHIQQGQQPRQILDVGTGCGVLGLSVLYHNTQLVRSLMLTEVSDEALEVARKNSERLFDGNDKITLLQSDLLKRPDIHAYLQAGQTILVANLPYIPEQMFDDNVADNVKKREPKMAFVGGDDGLDRYRQMFDQLFDIIGLQKNPNKITMYLEMMTRQIDILRQEYGEKLLFEEVKTFHFNIRIVKVIGKKNS